jgi:hypothetical protein
MVDRDDDHTADGWAGQHEIGGDDRQRSGGRIDLLIRECRIGRMKCVEALMAKWSSSTDGGRQRDG